MGMIAAAFAQVAFSDVTPALVSENLFGSIRIDSKSAFTMVGVPFEGFAAQFEDNEYYSEPQPNKILVRDVVSIDTLAPKDTMSIFDPDATSKEAEYHNYTLRQQKFGTQTFKFWVASSWFDEQIMQQIPYPEPDERLIEVSSGIFIGRNSSNNPANGYSIYAYGQIPQGFDYGKAITLEKGKTIISAPGEMAYTPLNLNSLEWSGEINAVKGERIDCEEYGLTPEDVADIFGSAYQDFTEFLIIDSITSKDDSIIYYDPETGNEVDLVYFEDSWYKKIDENTGVRDESMAVIPPGQAFWYLRGGDTPVTMKWSKATVQDEPSGD